MWFLIASILCSSAIFIIFRLFNRYEVNNLKAIILNYFVAAGFGLIYSFPEQNPMNYPWFWNAFFLGFIFIYLFVLMARVTREIGISIASISNKLSVVIPVLFATLFLKEELNLIAWTGIILCLLGTFLALYNKSSSMGFSILPLIIFIGSGALDTFLKYNQQANLSGDQHIWFTSSIFFFAGSFGLIYLLIKQKRISFQKKELSWGLILGVPNFFSILLILWTLEHFNDQSAKIFPINNLGVVLLASMISFLIFKEKRSSINKFGLILGVVGIAILASSL